MIRIVLLGLLLAIHAAQAVHARPVRVRVQSNAGGFTLELYPDKAPITVANFLEYVRSGFYQNILFHRSVSNFVIQGGEYDYPNAFETADIEPKPPNGTIANEAGNGLKNLRGTVAMARTSDPNSAASSFFVNVVDNPNLDPSERNAGYAVFGKVVVNKRKEKDPNTLEGMEVVDYINSLPVLGRLFSNVPQRLREAPYNLTAQVPIYIQSIGLLTPAGKAAAGVTRGEGAVIRLKPNRALPKLRAGATYRWSQISGPTATLTNASSLRPRFTAPTVEADTLLAFRLDAVAASGAVSTKDTVKVMVGNGRNVLDCSRARAHIGFSPVSFGQLLPFTGQVQPVAVTGLRPGGSKLRFRIRSVTSDEPVVNRAAGDGTFPDALIARGGPTPEFPRTYDYVQLRAERQSRGTNGAGSDNGRVYAINFSAQYKQQSCTGRVRVFVPGVGGRLEDDGQDYLATGGRRRVTASQPATEGED
jgi:peptidyl-prolyl cis-trans isomerase A (cyclophilin A)